jgi:hypothetical protein
MPVTVTLLVEAFTQKYRTNLLPGYCPGIQTLFSHNEARLCLPDSAS